MTIHATRTPSPAGHTGPDSVPVPTGVSALMGTPTGAAASGAPPVPRRPRADCTADSAGGLTFDVRLPVATAEAAVDAALLLCRRGGDAPADTVRLPLASTEQDGTLRAVLPSIMTLPEGRWDAFLAFGDLEPRRLLPGVHDLRSLIDRVPRQTRTWLGVRIPYATKYGNLTVRSWQRWPHAEAGRLRVEEGGLVLDGKLYGARLGSTARLEAHSRETAGTPVSVPVTLRAADGEDGTGESAAPGTDAAGDFTAELPLAALPVTHPVWDLWLRPHEGADPVRVARILDDVPDKKRIFSYPPQRVTDVEGDRAVRPYYTLDNDLSVRVSWAEAV